MSNYTDQWQQRIREKSAETERVLEMEFAGLKGLFRRVPLIAWMRSGRLPYFLLQTVRTALDSKGNAKDVMAKMAEAEKNLTATEYREIVDFQRELVCAVAVDPKIVDVADGEELPEGAIRYTELATQYPDVVDSIAGWALAGSPQIPVALVDGSEVSMQAIETFPNRRGRRANKATGRKSKTVRTTPSPRNRHS